MRSIDPAHLDPMPSLHPSPCTSSHHLATSWLTPHNDSSRSLLSSSKSVTATPGTPEPSITETLLRHVACQEEPAPRCVSQRRLNFEHSRPRLLRECVAEATGVFFFVFPGIASIASMTLHADDKVGPAVFGSLFQVGWAFGVGVALAIITCAPVSGGHFNPAITLAMAVWQAFPWWKVPCYILSQIFGSFVAGLLLMAVYWTQIQEANAAFLQAGKPLVAGGAPASILCPLPNADQTDLAYVFMIEFVVDIFIGVVIWAALDPANPFMKPASIPFVIALTYANMIWGFGNVTLSTNLARDLGTRMVAAIFYGSEAFTYMHYSPIGILVNVPATLLATAYYELLMRDSLALIGKGHAVHEQGDAGLYNHMRKTGILDEEKGIQLHTEKPHY